MMFEPTDEMLEYFAKRSERHISLVKKYFNKFYKEHKGKINWHLSPQLLNRIEAHDHSKFDPPEVIPYIAINWEYHCKRHNIPFDIDPSLREEMNEATNHHVKNNPHHPEYWDPLATGNVISKKNRDEPDSSIPIIDATRMPYRYLVEMCADWCAVSEERSNTPFDWAKKNIGVRWNFGKSSEDLIYKILELMWNN